jgi:microcystin-dependent protein
MPYSVNFSDRENKSPITVFDNTSNTDTSLTFPGRNVSGYGQIIAENFVNLLENFSGANAPVNPIEGQLWYDSANGVLQVFDNVSWKAASNIQKGPSEPAVEESKIGELWVDTANQQLRIFTGARWLLVGPSESSLDGLRYGASVETLVDVDNINRSVITFYVADVPVLIISKDSFIPKLSLPGFGFIRSGINIATARDATELNNFSTVFRGGLLPKLYGDALSADALQIGGVTVPSGNFLRTDVVNTTDFNLNVRNNLGVTIGLDGIFNLTATEGSANIYNSSPGSSIDLQTNRDGIPSTIIRIIDNKVGINKNVPDSELDVDGNVAVTGSLVITNTTESLNLNSGSLRTLGGMSIQKNLLIGDRLEVLGSSIFRNIEPNSNKQNNLGSSSKRWNNVFADTIDAVTINGSLKGNLDGTARDARALTNATSFKLEGDIVSNTISFDGQSGPTSKVFETVLTANIILNKNETPDVRPRSRSTDQLLIFRASEQIGGSSGLFRIRRDEFIADLGIPIGTILPFAGLASEVPVGFLLCDGSEVPINQFDQLFNVIQQRFSVLEQSVSQITAGNEYTIIDLGTTPTATWQSLGLGAGITIQPGITKFTSSRSGTINDGNGRVFIETLRGQGTFRLPDLRGRFPLGADNMRRGGLIPAITSLPGDPVVIQNIDAGGGSSGRVDGGQASTIGGYGGTSTYRLSKSNLPQHQHDLRRNNLVFGAIGVNNVQGASNTNFRNDGSTGVVFQIPQTSDISVAQGENVEQPFSLMNPYLTMNYIIRSGPPVFVVQN